jgi:hypothetical protein
MSSLSRRLGKCPSDRSAARVTCGFKSASSDLPVAVRPLTR